jgi:Cu-Zn family superoxide dismutase
MALSAAIAMSGCVADRAGSGGAAANSARATLLDATGATKGTATISETASGLRLVVEGTGLPQGAHGLHIHGVGKCEAPGFTTAGSHWNPAGKMHGRDAPGGAHMGDLPNLIVGTDGRGRAEAVIAGGRLTGGAMPLLDPDGAAIVVHATADDYRTDPSGNSGARIACGIFAAD